MSGFWRQRRKGGAGVPFTLPFFSVNTLTTVGCGDLTPTGDGAKLATVAYELAGIGVFVLLLSELARRSMLRRGVEIGKSDDPESGR